jgi:hypothetical protein
MGWWTRARLVVSSVLPPLAPPSAPAWTPPAHGYGDQLRTPAQRARMWRAHLERRAQEERAEQEQRRIADDAFQRDLERQPVRCHFPPSAVERTGFAGLFQFIDEMTRRH